MKLPMLLSLASLFVGTANSQANEASDASAGACYKHEPCHARGDEDGVIYPRDEKDMWGYGTTITGGRIDVFGPFSTSLTPSVMTQEPTTAATTATTSTAAVLSSMADSGARRNWKLF